MDMSKMAGLAATMPITADDMASVLRSAEPMMPEAAIVWSRRLLVALRAAEKMANAIEAYDAASERALDEETASDEASALVAAIESAIRFRQAMRGEL